jgi:holo-[acyl-carrier protein] synthase
MIIGIGIDIMEVARIKRSIERFGDHFLSRVFNRLEIEYCQSKGNPAVHFAARFAAKEAVVKSLGTGFSEGIKWTDVEIVSPRGGGKPEVKLHSQAQEVLKKMGGKILHLSITHDARYAMAQAVCEGSPAISTALVL